jgi:hypothetical protein
MAVYSLTGNDSSPFHAEPAHPDNSISQSSPPDLSFRRVFAKRAFFFVGRWQIQVEGESHVKNESKVLETGAVPDYEVLGNLLVKGLRRVLQIPKRLYAYREAAVYIGRSEQAVRHLVLKRAFPIHRYDGKPMIDVRDLDAWIDANKE